MGRFTGINHLALATGNMDATIRFWRDLVGLRLVAALGRPGYRQYFFEIAAQDLLTFFEWPAVEPLTLKDHGQPVRGPFGFDHVALGVRGEEDLWELRDLIGASGAWVSDVIDHGFIFSIYTFDPNGIPVEFSHPRAGVDLRRSPLRADPEPSAVTLEGDAPRPGVWPAPLRATPPGERVPRPGAGSEYFHGEK